MSSNPDPSRLASLSTAEKIRFIAFTLVVLGMLALNFALTPTEVLTPAFTGWFQDLGIHQLHDMTVATLVWIALTVPLALILYHPTGRVNTVLPPLIFAGTTAMMAFLAESFLFMGFAVMSALALVALLLHPAGRSLARFDRVESVDRRVAGLFAIGAIPLLIYAALELVKQLGPVDEHVVFVHYGAMSNAAFLVVIMGALAVYRQRDWRFAAWISGLIAAFVCLASVAYPGSESSLGLIGGGLLLLWAIAFVASVEYVRRSDAEAIESRAETEVEPA